VQMFEIYGSTRSLLLHIQLAHIHDELWALKLLHSGIQLSLSMTFRTKSYVLMIRRLTRIVDDWYEATDIASPWSASWNVGIQYSDFKRVQDFFPVKSNIFLLENRVAQIFFGRLQVIIFKNSSPPSKVNRSTTDHELRPTCNGAVLKPIF